MNETILSDVRRYQSYGWEWRLICKLVNFRYATQFSVKELRERIREAEETSVENEASV